MRPEIFALQGRTAESWCVETEVISEFRILEALRGGRPFSAAWLEKRRLRAALPMIENGDAEALGLVGEIAGDAGAREDDDACGQDVENAVVPFGGRGLAVGGPVGLKGDLRHLAMIGPAGCGFVEQRYETVSSFMKELGQGRIDCCATPFHSLPTL